MVKSQGVILKIGAFLVADDLKCMFYLRTLAHKLCAKRKYVPLDGWEATMQIRLSLLFVDNFTPVKCSPRAWNGQLAELLDPQSVVLQHCGWETKSVSLKQKQENSISKQNFDDSLKEDAAA